MNLLQQLFKDKRMLVVFSDPGGAKPLLALQKFIKPKDIRVVSDREYDFFKDFNIEVEKFQDDVESYFDKRTVDFLLTGTSYTSDIELSFIAEAVKNEIKTLSFVDHYTNIKERFISENGSFFPDVIWVIDELAKKIGVENGVEENKIVVLGNPYYEWLKGWKPEIKRESFLHSIGLNKNEHYILYAPDPLSNVDGFNTFGFDEISATKDILSLINQNSLLKIALKLHPNQNKEKLLEIIEKNKNIIIPSPDSNLNALIYYSDIVVGFFSSLLKEAQILGKKVVRFIPSTAKKDPFKDIKVGNIVNENSLISVLNI